ncbi:MAG: hypothetical protein HYY07_01045 [Elusimicrobia bacterium]|nr:hypothetical protein [Elusimicrobiota bacterium]
MSKRLAPGRHSRPSLRHSRGSGNLAGGKSVLDSRFRGNDGVQRFL